MAPRACSSIICFFLGLMTFMTAASWTPLPVEAAGGGVCQMAYGIPPTPIPDWLMPAGETTDLSTASRYDLLAAKLLSSGWVDGAGCPAYGLNPDGSATGCGLDLALKAVLAWQNQYDTEILAASRTNDLPPKVVKALIAVESQFWPAANWTRGEIGLGQMTAYGADLLLRWRPTYFQKVCRQSFGEKGCAAQYPFLDPATQSLLRGMVLREMDATCANCPGGVDPEKGKQAVQVLAETLTASFQQSARLIELATGKSPSSLLSYEDYWRLVLANYHAGAGCVYQALRRSADPNSWTAIASSFSSGCASGAEYIRRIEEQVKP